MRAIAYNEVATSVDTDVLSGSELDTMPGDGVLTIRAASTVNTATLEVAPVNGPAVSQARAITLRANGEIRSYDQPWVLPVEAGERVRIALAGTTGTVYMNVLYRGE